MNRVLLPHLAGVLVDRIERVGVGVHIVARSRSRGTRCPRCGGVGTRVHSRYERTVADAAIGGQPVALRIVVRRMFCDIDGCPARTFAEQINGLTERYSRRSVPLRQMSESIGLALAGRAGSRLAAKLGIVISRHTLLRLVRALPDPAVGVVPVLGVMSSRYAAAATTARC